VVLEVKQGLTSLTIEGDERVLPLMSTEVAGGVLRIKRTSKEWLRSNVKVRVTTPNLTRLKASGGVNVSMTGVTAKNFEAQLSGGVELEAPGLALEALEIDASGGAKVSLSGRARVAKLTFSGGVEANGKELEIDQARVDASGGCTLQLKVKDSITGDLSGGVELTVLGNPPKSRVGTSGGATVEYVN
jgi:hypothetical protein